jgi:hypothetical protein
MSRKRVYKDIPGMPGYRVGDDGTVWSNRRSKNAAWKQLKPKVDKRGYHWFRPRVGGVYFDRKAGRLVLEAFVGPKPEGQLVRHLNDIRSDNRRENLQYGTVAENAEDARRNGKLCIGEKHGRAKINEDTVRLIRSLKGAGKTYPEITELTGVKKSLASHVVTRRLWRHVL